MLGGKKLVIEPFCEVYDLLEPYADHIFNAFIKHKIVDNAIYVMGRASALGANREKILNAIDNHGVTMVFSNPAEGSQTIKHQLERVGYDQYIKQGRMLLIGGGDMEQDFKYIRYDSFLPKLYDYNENVAASERIQEIYDKTEKPYKFLFLNGRSRLNRKYLLKSFERSGLLNQSLWTNLDSWYGKSAEIKCVHNGIDLMELPIDIKLLPEKYEVEQYRQNLNLKSDNNFVKFDLFKNNSNFDWGEIYLVADAYIDTYFSLVTETVFTYPYSFRTEKIWKPIAMGHPWIAVANAGYYRDLKALGFKTFDSIIDESFDQIDDNQKRIERIRDVVEDLCKTTQNLKDFLAAAKPICEFNQKHLWIMRYRVRQEFPNRFKEFLRSNNVI